MNEETQNTGVELTDEDVENATGGASDGMVVHHVKCPSCGYSYSFKIQSNQVPYPPPCPSCGYEWVIGVQSTLL